MNKIKIALTKIKNDIQENPADYAVALAAGVAVGVVAVLISRNEDKPESPCHLHISQDIATYMRDTGTKTLFETPIGEFQLEYVNH